MSKYVKQRAGEWVQPIRRGYKMMCCDCGLVHVINFRVAKYGRDQTKVQFQVFRDNRATANARRRKRP